MIVYTKLWLLLKERDMKKTDLLKVISSPTLAKLGKNEPVSISIIEKICDFLDCQPGDIMSNEKQLTQEEAMEKLKEMGNMQRVLMDKLKENGIDTSELFSEMQRAMPEIIKKLQNDENPYNFLNIPQNTDNSPE